MSQLNINVRSIVHIHPFVKMVIIFLILYPDFSKYSIIWLFLRMQAFKKKDPYITSTRLEVVKPTFNGELWISLTLFNNHNYTDQSQLVFHIPEDKRCLRMDEVYLSFKIQIPNCYLPGIGLILYFLRIQKLFKIDFKIIISRVNFSHLLIWRWIMNYWAVEEDQLTTASVVIY